MNKAKKVTARTESAMPMRALIYCRVSSERQKTDGHGLDSQQHRCRILAEQKGLHVDRVFSDSYSGGGDFWQRPAMRALLGYADEHAYTRYAVIFDDLSRFARDVEFHLRLRKEFDTRGLQPLCPNFDFSETAEGRFAEIIVAAKNEYERVGNKRQVIQKMKARLEAGYWPFASKKAYTKVYDPTRGNVHKPATLALQVLKPALEGFATGNLLRKIDVARFLVERDYWKNQSPEHYVHRVDEILRDSFHCGDIEYPAWEIQKRKGQHEGIISRETHELILKRLKNDGVTTRIRLDISNEFPLRGLLTCSACNKSVTACMSGGRSKKYAYYYCQQKSCSLYGKMLPRKDVESDFRILLLHNRLKADVGQVVDVVFDRVWKQEVGELEQQKKRAERHQSELKAKIADLSEMVRRAQSEAVQRAYEGQIEQAAKEQEELQSETSGGKYLSVPYRTALCTVNGLLKNPLAIWESVDVLEKHRLFFFLFEAKLPYTKNEGYRTGDLLSTTRLFEEVATANSQDVVFV